ncbi:lantibiotic dehydratase [Sphaerimonospora mesophila]|uniref:lantibiotic dehydratase n=1 Tax=Sphaerimonospora mesophila TaxID=37483 RepID=UPI0006E46626
MTLTDGTPVAGEAELLALPGGPLRVWPVAVLRGAGFPIADLVALGDPEYAAAADPDEATVAEAEARQHRRLAAVAARPDLQTAIAWQNPAVLRDSIRPLALSADARRNQSLRRKERVLARYWARYCAKNDTIGFFGPVCWVRLRPDGPFATVETGPELVNGRAVHLEPWAVDELAAVFSADPAVRPWLAPRPNPATCLHERQVLRTDGPPVPLSPDEWRVLRRCDGTRTARDLAAELIAEDPGAFPRAEAVYGLLDEFVAAGHIRWDMEPPLVMRPEKMLRAAVTAIGDPRVRARLHTAMDALDAGVAGVARAETADELDGAMRALDETFTGLTGQAPSRRPGETYGGRGLVHLDTSRDARIDFGPGLLRRLGPPLSLLAYSLRGYTAELATRYGEVFLRAYDMIRASGPGPVRLAHLLGLCAHEVYIPGHRLLESIEDSFAKRWDDLLDVDRDAAEVRHTSAGLWPAVREAFHSGPPGWIQAYQHSADIQLAAPDPAAIARGECLLVLGELHAAWNTIEAGVFVDRHPDPARLSRLLAASLPGERVVLVPVKHYPRVLARTMPAIPDERQWWLAMTHYPGGDPDRRVNLAELCVERAPDGLRCATPDGRAEFRVIDVVGMLLAADVMDAFKLLGRDRPHVPRILVDDLVVARESWSVPLADLALPPASATESRVFRAVRALAARLGLPRFVFVKLPGELKPFYLDLTSSVQAATLVTGLRRARQSGDLTAWVRFTEMLPGPGQAWLPGPDGARYTSELRLQLVDPGTPW